MNSLLLWIGGLLVAVLGLLFAAPYVIDWNAYRGVLEEEASRLLGRDVRVGGKVNLRLLPSPYVRFEKVRISDAGAALGEPFFRAEAFTLWLSPAPLLRGAIEAKELELDQPVLRLAVDAEGRGNWQALQIKPGALPFVPNEVILQEVRIRNGTVSLRTPNAPEPLTLSGIEGELAASSLDGPFRFRGVVDWYGAVRELRLGTAQREANGSLRYKATVRSLQTGNLYAIDGSLSELTARAKHSGTLTARLPLANFTGAITSDAGTDARAGRSTDAVEVRANIDADMDGARLTDLSFSFEQDGKPQMLSGESSASWRSGLRIETRLASRWLDLNAFTGQAAGEAGEDRPGSRLAPVDIVRRLIGQVSALLPTDGNSLLTIDVDQVNFGSDALSGVRLALARAGGLTSIGELRATLPGNARGELRGTFGANRPTAAATDARAAAEAFDGTFVLHGTSFHRFASWAGAGGIVGATGAAPGSALDAPFSIASQIRLLPDSMALTNANIELSERQATAWIDWRWGGDRRLELGLEGPAIDIAAFAPGGLDVTRPGATATPDDRPSSGTGFALIDGVAARAAAIERAVGGFRLRLRARELSDGTTTLRDVDADISIQSGKLGIAGIKLTGPAALRLELQGELSSFASKPSGDLRGWLAAGTREAVAEISDALPPGARPLVAPWLSRSSRADLGFSVRFGGRQADQVSIKANGLVDEARLALGLGLDGGLGQWRAAPVDLTMSLDGSSAAEAISRMVGRVPIQEGLRLPFGEMSLKIKAAGPNAASLLGSVVLEMRQPGSPTRVTYDGRAGVAADGGIELSGDVVLASADAAELLALSGQQRRLAIVGTPLSGTIKLDRMGGVTTLAAAGLSIGSSRVTGQATLARSSERTRLDGHLTTTRLSLPALLGLVQDADATPSTSAGISDAGAAWPEAPITLRLLDGLEGQLSIAAPLASLTRDLDITDAELVLAMTPGRLAISNLTGAALGGRFSARSTIEPVQGGASFAIDARLTGARLDQIAAAAAQRRQSLGEANVTVAMTGRGLSIAAAMATMSGKGEIEIRNGRVQGIALGLVERAAVTAIEGKDEITRAGLAMIIEVERGRSQLALGNRKLPVEIADGIAKVGALEIGGNEASVRNLTTVDLAALKVDSEWQIAPRRPVPGGRSADRRAPLPALSIVWSGPLATIGRTDPRVSVETLERELNIRKMERDAERLEELRLQDEERARIEAERLRRLDESARGPGAGQITTPPVIHAPLPIPPTLRQTPQLPPPPPGAPRRQSLTDPMQPPGAAPSSASPPAALPPPPRREGARTLQDALMGPR